MNEIFNKLNIDDKLDGAVLQKVVVNNSINTWNFYITIKYLISYSLYLDIKSNISNFFDNAITINLILITDDKNDSLLYDYFIIFFNKVIDTNNKYEVFRNRNICVNDYVINIDIFNSVEYGYIKDIVKVIEPEFINFGFSNFSFNYNVIEDSNISEDISRDLEVSNINYVYKDNKSDFQHKRIAKKDRTEEITFIRDITYEMDNINIKGEVFGIDFFESKKGFKIFTLKVTDYTDSIYLKIFARNDEETESLNKLLKNGKCFTFFGKVVMDKYSNELVFNSYYKDISETDGFEKNSIIDDEDVKRVELHAHTMMSQMDGITRLDLNKHTCELVSKCIEMGYSGVAITDHNGCQAFPVVYDLVRGYNKKVESDKKFKVLYGVELTLVDDTVDVVIRSTDSKLMDMTYVVFDTETTGFNAGGADQMIEIGAVKIKDGVIVDRFDELIDPGRHIPDKITELTCITDDMVRGKDNEEVVTKKFLEWVGDLPMVAHNAKFDISFIESAMRKYNLGNFQNTVIDTLELSRIIDQGYARHGLSALVKRYNVPWDEDAHHRADYDAEGTALVFYKMIEKLNMQNLELISDLDKLLSKDEIYKFGRSFHFNVLVLNKTGLKNLFKIISLANTVYLYKTPRILRSKLNELREGLLIGSGCYESEVFKEARSKSGEEISNIISFYDYVEVQPPEVYGHLIQTSDFKDELEVKEHLKNIIDATIKAGKIIVASGDVHHFYRSDKIYREIIINQKVPGGGRHPLCKKDITDIPSQHFRTTREMLDNFSFLDKDLAYEIVVVNTNKILNMAEEVEVIIDTGGIPFSPRVKSDDGKSYLDCPRVVTDLVFDKAREWYSDNIPNNILERISTELYGSIVYKFLEIKLREKNPNISEDEFKKLLFDRLFHILLDGFDKVQDLVQEYVRKNWNEEDDGELNDNSLMKKVKKELGGVIGGGFDPIYLIAQRLVKHSNDEGFLVGSRGSVGSSFVATLMGITEVNPLPAHYRCLKCKHSIFDDDDGKALGSKYSSGFDLPDKHCPLCNEILYKDGQDMPFATFLGFNADKVPDIDLNFSDLNQASAHEYTKVLFGVDNVYRAGTIGTVADKTAFGFVKGYFEDKGIMNKRNAEVERLSMGCTGVKRTTGQHPGGIVVVPDYMDVSDFTPFQFPADDSSSAWRTTHFDYHAIDQDLLKLDILGHSDPTQLRLIGELSGTDVLKVPLDDKETMSIFTSTKALGVSNDDIMCNTGTLGIPEFGTPFTIGLVYETKPTTFAELVKISGLSHGTDVWLGNAQELIRNNVVPFKDVIGCRDDIMVYLMYNGVEAIKAFKIMEFVRKGKASKDPETWLKHKETMEKANIPSWFIDSCAKIKYMFPKAHAAAYVISAFRIAWYKVHMPVYFYASWYSTKATDFDIEAMIGGVDSIRNAFVEIESKGHDITNKESGVLECLKVALEMACRGIKVSDYDLYKSRAMVFTVLDDNTVIPAFKAIEGLGDVVANNIEVEAKKSPFLSIEDFQKRCKVSTTLVDKMRNMGVFNGMPETSQLSLF